MKINGSMFFFYTNFGRDLSRILTVFLECLGDLTHSATAGLVSTIPLLTNAALLGPLL